MRCFITYLHPARFDPVGLEQLEDGDRMSAKVLQHLLIRMALPGFGNRLVLRVCPIIGIMEVHHYLQTLFLGPETFVQQVLAAVESVCGIYPNTESQGIESQLLHQSGTLHRRVSFEAIEFLTPRLHLRLPTDVGPEPES